MLTAKIQRPDLTAKLQLELPTYTGYRPRNSFARIVQGVWEQGAIPNRPGAIQATLGQVYRAAPYFIAKIVFEDTDCFEKADPILTVTPVSRYAIGFDTTTHAPTGIETRVDISAFTPATAQNMGENFNTFDWQGFGRPGGVFTVVAGYVNSFLGVAPGFSGGEIGPNVWNLRVEIKPQWVIADLFSNPITADFVDGAKSVYNVSVAFGLTTTFPTAPPPIPETASTIPIQAYINETGQDPTFRIANRIGVLQNSPVNRSVWEPTENETFHPEIDGGTWEDIIGWNLESADTNPVPVGEDGVPSISSPTISYVFAFGRQTYHVWTGDLSKAAPDFAGYLIHTDDPKRKTFNPPAGIIYPFYLTPRTFA